MYCRARPLSSQALDQPACEVHHVIFEIVYTKNSPISPARPHDRSRHNRYHHTKWDHPRHHSARLGPQFATDPKNWRECSRLYVGYLSEGSEGCLKNDLIGSKGSRDLSPPLRGRRRSREYRYHYDVGICIAKKLSLCVRDATGMHKGLPSCSSVFLAGSYTVCHHH